MPEEVQEGTTTMDIIDQVEGQEVGVIVSADVRRGPQLVMRVKEKWRKVRR